jgi:regulator of protease activity HflC (stomatin/prohibitin superfamily)
VGFKISNSGDYRGIDSLPLVTGYQLYFPFTTSIVTMPTTQQHVVWSESEDEGSKPNQEITISCKGGAGFKVDVGVNYRVDANKASKIYLKYKTDDLENITNTYLRNVVRGSMQDVSGLLTVDSVLNNLPGYEHAVRDTIRKRFAVQGFILDNFSILKQPDPTDQSLKNSIANKIKAKQDAETAKTQLQSSVAEANKRVAEAKGDSAARIIRASGEAEAVKKLQQVLTPTYVDYIKWSKADGNVARVPQTVTGSGTLYSISK